jgi:hypothetical protein
MSGKAVRAILAVVLLALAITFLSPARVVPPPAHAATPVMIMAEEHGTTGS